MPEFALASDAFLAFLNAQTQPEEALALRVFDSLLPTNMVQERADARMKAVAIFTRSPTYHH